TNLYVLNSGEHYTGIYDCSKFQDSVGGPRIVEFCVLNEDFVVSFCFVE
ncbi:unnamed protein product, partial [Allacma fusca]